MVKSNKTLCIALLGMLIQPVVVLATPQVQVSVQSQDSTTTFRTQSNDQSSYEATSFFTVATDKVDPSAAKTLKEKSQSHANDVRAYYEAVSQGKQVQGE